MGPGRVGPERWGQVGGVQVQHGDGVGPDQHLELAGADAGADLGHQVGRVGPGGVLVRVVRLEDELLDPDLVPGVHPHHVVEEAAEDPSRAPGSRAAR